MLKASLTMSLTLFPAISKQSAAEAKLRGSPVTTMMSETRLPITGLIKGQIPPSVLVCGDPARASKTTAFLENAERLSEQREYHAFAGLYEDVPVAVCSHGVGAAGAAIAFEELIAAGARRLIRIGTCGGLQPQVTDGDLVVATAAVDCTGFGRLYVPEGYPAVADWRVSSALFEAARLLDKTCHNGIVLTNDNFYAGVETPRTPHYPTMAQAQVLAVEMECAALFLVGSMRGVQTGAILAVDGNVLESGESMDEYDPHRSVVGDAVTAEIQIALRALAQLARSEEGA